MSSVDCTGCGKRLDAVGERCGTIQTDFCLELILLSVSDDEK